MFRVRHGQAVPRAGELDSSDALSTQKNRDEALNGRKVGIHFAEGSGKAIMPAVFGVVDGDRQTRASISPAVR